MFIIACKCNNIKTDIMLDNWEISDQDLLAGLLYYIQNSYAHEDNSSICIKFMEKMSVKCFYKFVKLMYDVKKIAKFNMNDDEKSYTEIEKKNDMQKICCYYDLVTKKKNI